MTDYEPMDMAEAMTEYERVNAEPGNNQNEDRLEKYVRLPERDGFTLLRFLPRKKGNKLCCATRIHTLVNPSNGQKRTYHCPKVLVQTDNGPRWQGECIICKYYSDLWNQSNSLSGKAQEEIQNKARSIKPVERYYYNVIVRSEKDKNNNILKNVGPKIFSCGKTIHAKIMRAIVGDDTAGEKPLGDITDPKNGRDFRVVKKVVKGGNNSEFPNYDNSKFEDPSPTGSPEDLNKWLDGMHDLQSLRTLKNAEELRHALKVHLGMVVEGAVSANDDLEEFRNAGKNSNVSEVVREDLTSASVKTETPKDSPEETLADEDFMKELEGM